MDGIKSPGQTRFGGFLLSIFTWNFISETDKTMVEYVKWMTCVWGVEMRLGRYATAMTGQETSPPSDRKAGRPGIRTGRG